MLTELAGVCVVDTLLPHGAPPFGPGIVCVASAAMPLEMTTIDLPSSVPGLMLPKLLRIETRPQIAERRAVGAEELARR